MKWVYEEYLLSDAKTKYVKVSLHTRENVEVFTHSDAVKFNETYLDTMQRLKNELRQRIKDVIQL